MMRVIATAGHVDHGKSALVEALTGTHPDRLAEEQARQLTIDLGFAWLQLPGGETVGIVDVPGHEDFIENMLAGVGGIDLGLLVVAADEGVMPQTREHLAILDLLAVPGLVVALTKTDLVTDPEWLELVELDVQERLATTRFAQAPFVPVSARDGTGLEALVETLAGVLAAVEGPSETGLPRLPVDRVFTVSGFGTVVTGTLRDGPLHTGDAVVILPQDIEGRVRGLQSHHQDVERAVPGSRVAVNVAGVDTDEVQRGDVLTLAGHPPPTTLLDVQLALLNDAPRPLKHNAEVKVFAGPSEAMARVRLLVDRTLPPGQETWAQLQLAAPLALVRGQRFIVRFPSPPATIGGGVILDTAPGRKWRRNRPNVLARFQRLVRGTPLDLVSEALIHARQPLTRTAILARTGLPDSIWPRLADESALVAYGEEWLAHEDTLAFYRERLAHILGNYHRQQPLQPGMPLQALANRLRLPERALQIVLALLATEGAVAVVGEAFVHLPDFQVQYTSAQRAAIEELEAAFVQQPYTPPSIKEALEILGSEKVLDALVAQGQLVRLGSDVLLAPDVYHEWGAYVRDRLAADGEVKLSELRDTFDTSRKYALAFLDHLESLQITRRVGDVHQRGRGDWSLLV